MRAVIQRVSCARVDVAGELVSSIGRGLLVLVGVGREDGEDDKQWLANKIVNLRLWPNADGKPWSASVLQQKYEILMACHSPSRWNNDSEQWK